MSNILKLGIPKGSLQDATAELFRRAGTKSASVHGATTPPLTMTRSNVSSFERKRWRDMWKTESSIAG